VISEFLTFNRPDLGEEEMSAVMDVIRSGWIGTGQVCTQFEEEFAGFMGGGYAVGVSSCTMGLQLALKALGIGENDTDEVITTPLTFAATINAVLAVGAKPVLVDVTREGIIDLEKVNENVDLFTKAVIPVHYSGIPVDLSKLDPSLKLKVVEDCAHAFGSLFGKKGDFQVFSFYANKNITAGEGGMVLTRDKRLADEIRVLSSQGLSQGAWMRYGTSKPRQYSVEKIGVKGNLPDVLAAIGLVQLRRWPEMRQKRLQVWRVYEKAFGSKGLGQSTHFYPLRVANRDQVRLRLHEKGIGTGIHYKPLHLEPAYKFLGYKEGDFPNAEAWGRDEISLPVSSKMTDLDANRVVYEVKGAIS
jgi:dTDP-4-amino-4,6-dideoxygalactose transaminase